MSTSLINSLNRSSLWPDNESYVYFLILAIWHSSITGRVFGNASYCSHQQACNLGWFNALLNACLNSHIWHTYLSFLNYLCWSHTLKHFELIQRLNGVLLRWKVCSFNEVSDCGVAWEQRHHSVVTATAIYKIESFRSEIFLLTSKWTISVCPSNSQVFPDRGRCQLDTNRKVECSIAVTSKMLQKILK